jgi:hypothetical protein
LHDDDIAHLQTNLHLLFGCQVIPAVAQNRPRGLGHLEYEYYVRDDRTIHDIFTGAVAYSDGSCLKGAHSSLNAAGWALIVLTDSGELDAALWGQVGDGLPQTSPASEYVAGLAGSTLQLREVRSDYKGLAALEHLSIEALASRKNIYSGLRVQIKGRNPSLQYSKVKGHVGPESCAAGSAERRDAIGNQYADQFARKGAELHNSVPFSCFGLHSERQGGPAAFLSFCFSGPHLLGARRPFNGQSKAASSKAA